MGIFDTLGGGSYYGDEDEDAPRYSYSNLESGHPLLSSTPMGGLATEDVGRYYGGTVPGAEGFGDTGYGGMAWSGIKEGLFAPLAGLAERAGLFEEGTRQGIRDDFEKSRLEFLSQDPGVFRTVVAGLAELAPSAVPYAPVGTVGKLATTLAPRMAKYGLQATKLADPKFLARGLAATGGAGIGLGETTGGSIPEQLFGVGLGGALGSLAGRLDIPEGGMIDRLFKEEGIVDDLMGPSSGFRGGVEEARKAAAYKAGAREQEALFEINVAKAHADADPTLEGYDFISKALTDREQLQALTDIRGIDDPIVQAISRARNVLDQQSEILVSPGGKVYDNFQRQVEKVEGEFAGLSDDTDTIMDFIREDVRLLEPEEISSLAPNVQQAYKSAALMNTIEDNKGEYLGRVYEAFSDPEFAQNRIREIDDVIERFSNQEKISPAEEKMVGAYDTLMNSIIHDKNGKLKPYYRGEEGIERARKKLFRLIDRSTTNPVAWGKGKMPRTEWGNLKKRSLTDTNPRDRALRTLLGEDTDAFRGLQRTVKRITADQEAYTFKKTLADDLVSRGDASRELVPGQFDYEVTQLREAGLPPVYVNDPKLAAELGDIISGSEGGILDTVNYFSKAMATVMNPVTHSRNVLANPTFLVYSGVNPLEVFRPKNLKDAGKMLKLLDSDPSKAIVKMGRKELDEFKEASFAMMERGMLENVDVSDLARYHEEIAQRAAGRGGISALELMGKGTEKLTGGVGRVKPAKLYQNEDFFFKNLGYQARKRQWEGTKAFTPEQVKELTIQDLDRMLPTYSRRSKATEKFRKAQFIAPFVNFYSELIRTAKQSMEMASKQLMDPKGFIRETLGLSDAMITDEMVSAVRKMGGKRAAGMAGVAGLPLALQKASQIWNDVSPEEDKAAREYMAPWDKKSPVAYLGKEPGKFSFLNLGYLFPHAALTTPSELIQPFTSPAIPVSEAFEAYKDLSRSSELGLDEKAKIVAKHGYRALMPGFVKQSERIAKGAAGLGPRENALNRWFPNENRYGKQYSLTKELLAPAGRPTEQDVLKGLRFKATSYSRGQRQARDLVNETKNAHPQRTISAINNAKREHEDLAQEFIDQIQNARTLGTTDEQIKAMLKELGTIPTDDRNLLMRGIIPAFRPPRWTENG